VCVRVCEADRRCSGPLSRSPVHVADLVVQRQEGNRRLDGLPALRAQPDDLQSGLVDLLRQLVHGDVTGSAHQHRPTRNGEVKR